MTLGNPLRPSGLAIGPGEVLLLTVVLAFIWWQAVRAPVHLPAPAVSSTPQAEGEFATAEQPVDRPPTSREVLLRGGITSVIAVTGCLAGRWLIRRASRRE